MLDPIEHLWEILYGKSNGQVTNDASDRWRHATLTGQCRDPYTFEA